MVETLRLSSSTPDLNRVAQLLEDGGIVAFPTETVYGLGADATNSKAVARVYEAKGRPSFNPLIVHVADLETAQHYGVFNDISLELAELCWPGPMSLIVPVRKDSRLSQLVTAGLDSVAIRVPAHHVAHSLLNRFGGAIAAPSANISGAISPTTAEHVIDGLDGKIDAIVSAGECVVGLESTIIDARMDEVRILRAGGVTPETLRALLGRDIHIGAISEEITAPGQLSSHYAPNASIELNVGPEFDGILIGFGPDYPEEMNLSSRGEVIEAAANLFSFLRIADQLANGKKIGIAPVPDKGLGLAINDRIKRAAAPKSS